MEPAIFDTTVWIDFINGVDNRQTQLLEQTTRQYPDFLLITPTILQGLRTEADFNRIKTILDSFRMLAPDWPTVTGKAARLCYTLRKKRAMICKSTDCLIARIALRFDVLPVHNDSDFDQTSQHTPLRTWR